MTAMTRWQGSLDPADLSGTATFTAAGMVVAVQLGFLAAGMQQAAETSFTSHARAYAVWAAELLRAD